MTRKVILAAIALAAVVACAAPASAALIYVYQAPFQTYQNTANNPCVFYGPGTCPADPALWPDPASPTNGSFDPLTQTYTGTDYWPTIWSSFVLGLDINDTSTSQTLTGFTINWNGGTVEYAFATPLVVPNSSNGIGWADYILAAGCSGTTSGSGASTTCSQYTPFTAPAGATNLTLTFSYGTTGNDGPDKVFVIPGTVPENPVPEPASMVLLGTGLVGLAYKVRRRK